MDRRTETKYKNYWIEVVNRDDDGLYFADVRITRRPPENERRRWRVVPIEPRVHLDEASAIEDAVQQAKLYIDRLENGVVSSRSAGLWATRQARTCQRVLAQCGRNGVINRV